MPPTVCVLTPESGQSLQFEESLPVVARIMVWCHRTGLARAPSQPAKGISGDRNVANAPFLGDASGDRDKACLWLLCVDANMRPVQLRQFGSSDAAKQAKANSGQQVQFGMRQRCFQQLLGLFNRQNVWFAGLVAVPTHFLQIVVRKIVKRTEQNVFSLSSKPENFAQRVQIVFIAPDSNSQ